MCSLAAETGTLPSQWANENEQDMFTVLHILTERAKAEEAAAKGKKYIPEVGPNGEIYRG